jgi:predicted GIY-YIG superfamily endonuclease
MSYFVYILRTMDNCLYIGHTNNLSRREIEHKRFHHGAKFIKDNGSTFIIVFSEEYLTRAEAMKREKQLKRWTRAKKEALISGNLVLLKKI